MSTAISDSFVVQGKLALPYQYFAGRTGSRFIISLRDEKKIRGLKCDKCGKIFVPPRASCETCIVDISENWVDVKNTGVVTGFTIIRYKEPHQPMEPPYILGLIKLDGADTPLAHIVKGVALSKMETGLKVKAVFAKKTTGSIMDIDHFQVLDDKPKFEMGYSYDELEIGMSASFTKTISETDVYLFAGISGDFNPMHMNEEFAKMTPFGTRIAHGALPQSLIAPVLGMKLPDWERSFRKSPSGSNGPRISATPSPLWARWLKNSKRNGGSAWSCAGPIRKMNWWRRGRAWRFRRCLSINKFQSELKFEVN